MSITSVNNPWRRSVLQQLNARNQREQIPFQSVFFTCNSLYEKIDSLQREKLLLENNSSPVSANPSTEKINQLQNEIKSYQKTCTENAATISELSSQLQSALKEKSELKLKYKDAIENIEATNIKCTSLQDTVRELESQNTVISDEHTALQIAYTSLKNKFDSLEREHTELITRWVALKDKESKILNDENERINRIQNEKIKKQLEDAVNEMNVSADVEKQMNAYDDDVIENLVPIECIVPTKVSKTIEAHSSDLYAIKWNRSNDFIATGGGDRKVKIWDVSDTQPELRDVLTGSNAAVTSIDIFEDFLVASSNDHASRVWSLNDVKLRRTLTGHSNKVMSVKFLDVSNQVVSGSCDKTLKIWDLNRNACVRTLFAGSSCFDLVNITSKDSLVASGHYDKRLRFWDTRSDYNSNDILLQGKITSLDVSTNGSWLLCSVREEQLLKCLDLRMNQFIKDYTADDFNIGCDWTRAKFSPDNKYIACGGHDSDVFIWESITGKLLTKQQSTRHTGAVVSVEWHPKGFLFASADRNKNVILWK